MSDRNPWAVLGLAVGTTDELEVRRAYAAKVRESPPEKDPEGFRRARDAYETLRKGDPFWLKYLADNARGRDPDEPDDDDEADEDGAGNVEVLALAPTHDAVLVDSWKEMISSALARTDAGRAASIQSAVVAAARQAEDSPANLSALAGALRDEPFAAHEAVLAGALPAAAVRASLERGDGALAGWAVDALSLAGNVAALARAADVAAELKDVHDPAALHALVGLARAAALVSPKSAKRLADSAWTLAPPAVRPRLGTDAVDLAVAAAKDVADWPPADRALLARIVYSGGVDGQVDPQRFHRRLRRSQRSHQVRRLVAEIAPELMPAVVEVRRPNKPPEPEKQKAWVQAVVAIVILIGAVSRISKCGEQKPTRSPLGDKPWSDTRRDLDRVRRSARVLAHAERRELDEFHQRIAGETLSPAERTRFKVLADKHIRSADIGPGATGPLSAFERNELAAYRARMATGETLSTDEFIRRIELMGRERTRDVPQEHPPNSRSGGR